MSNADDAERGGSMVSGSLAEDASRQDEEQGRGQRAAQDEGEKGYGVRKLTLLND